MSNKIIVVDLSKKPASESELEISYPIGVYAVYRSDETRALDEEYGKRLNPESLFTPMPMGSCFTQGDIILAPLAKLANKTGFYFGVDVDSFGKNKRKDIDVCVDEGAVKLVQYKGNDVVLPIKFV